MSTRATAVHCGGLRRLRKRRANAARMRSVRSAGHHRARRYGQRRRWNHQRTQFISLLGTDSDPIAPESDAVMALAMDSGAVKWVRQTTTGDAFTVACMDPSPDSMVACPDSNGPDYDFGSSAILIRREDGTRLLLAGQKSGWMYALNPDSGEIVWRTECRIGTVAGR